MVTKVQKWGNSQGIRLTKTMLEEARLSVGDEVELTVESGRLVIEPSQGVRGRYRLEDLLEGLPDGSRIEEVNWGPPVGKEIL